jgi:serine phosphatase RsbU (regulator of sigma subunit)
VPDAKQRILLASPQEEQVYHWRRVLEDMGWQVDTSFKPWSLSAADCTDYQIVVAETGGEGIQQFIELLDHCSEHDSGALLPILSDATPEMVINLIRQGVVDVLLSPFSDHELVETVNRVAGHKSLYDENLAYSDQLERTNRELKESLNILKMDQLAGKQVQKTMLPITPLHHGDFTIAHRIVPSLYLSGDFVGYNIVFDRFLLFYLADVSGHGASSAFITILLKFILRRILRRHLAANDIQTLALAPQGFIEHVNRQIIATSLEKHLTMFAGAIDMETSIFRYGIAAQVPMPILLADGEARYLSGKGKPVGLFENASWEIQQMSLPREFGLVIASDGLLDALPGDALNDKEAYFLETVASAGSDHDKLCARLGIDDVREPLDDISLLTINRRSMS